jgi:hypothetical protein
MGGGKAEGKGEVVIAALEIGNGPPLGGDVTKDGISVECS